MMQCIRQDTASIERQVSVSDKRLTELEWKKFSKGRGFKDATFIKALAALEKAKSPDATLAALAEIEKQADALGKAQKSDKELATYLDELDKALVKQRRLSELEAKQAARQDESDEEEESPALLTTKLAPLLRQVRKGDPMSVLLASTGKDVAVLLSRRAISSTRRKLLTDYLDGGTAKFFPGSCVFEDNAYTFVLKTQAAGLAKKVRAALLEQTGLRVKVRVRGEDPNDVDDDGEPAEPEEGGDTVARAAGEAAATPASAPADQAAPGDPQRAEYETRVAAMEPRVVSALREQVGDATKIRAVMGFVQQKGEAGQYAAALAGLDNLAKLLSVPPVAPDAGTAAFTARLAGLKDAIAAALAAGGARASEIKLKFSEVGALARQKDFEAAGRSLDELSKLLGEPAAPAEPTASAAPAGQAPASDRARSEHAALRSRLEANFLAATAPGADPRAAADIATVRRAWDLADESAAAGQFERAVLILQRMADGGALAALVRARAGVEAKASVKLGPSLVEQRAFMLERWTRIPAEIKVELQSLRDAIVQDELDDEPQELVDAIESRLQEMLDDVQERLNHAVNTGDRSVFKGLRQRVENDATLGLLVKAPFIDGTRFRQTTLAAIDEIETALA